MKKTAIYRIHKARLLQFDSESSEEEVSVWLH